MSCLAEILKNYSILKLISFCIVSENHRIDKKHSGELAASHQYVACIIWNELLRMPGKAESLVQSKQRLEKLEKISEQNVYGAQGQLCYLEQRRSLQSIIAGVVYASRMGSRVHQY